MHVWLWVHHVGGSVLCPMSNGGFAAARVGLELKRGAWTGSINSGDSHV